MNDLRLTVLLSIVAVLALTGQVAAAPFLVCDPEPSTADQPDS
jgi:hypothetical protein